MRRRPHLANVYWSQRILQIDKRTGAIVGEVDASGVVPDGVDPASSDQVLNGTAYRPETDTFYITGKLWPVMLEVRFAVQNQVDVPSGTEGY